MTIKEACGSGVRFLAVVLGAAWCWASESSYQRWQFADSANPAAPTVGTNVAGIASATIREGYLSAGWLADLPGLGSQTGLWDMGFQDPESVGRDTRGVVLLSVPSPAASGVESSTVVEVGVVQFVGGPYTGSLTFSLPESLFEGRTNVETLPGPFGGAWVEDKYQWRVSPSPLQISLVLTGAMDGTLLDSMWVQTASDVPHAPDVVITTAEKRSQVLAIGWTGGKAPYAVDVSTNLQSSEAWMQFGPAISVTNIEIPVDEPEKFVRVRGSR